jgi:hypothetical protein
MVRSCLSLRGRVFLIDNHRDPLPHRIIEDPYVLQYQPDRHIRHLGDGRGYNVVKVLYEPDELKRLLHGLGWAAQIMATRWFLYGSVHPRVAMRGGLGRSEA